MTVWEDYPAGQWDINWNFYFQLHVLFLQYTHTRACAHARTCSRCSLLNTFIWWFCRLWLRV